MIRIVNVNRVNISVIKKIVLIVTVTAIILNVNEIKEFVVPSCNTNILLDKKIISTTENSQPDFKKLVFLSEFEVLDKMENKTIENEKIAENNSQEIIKPSQTDLNEKTEIVENKVIPASNNEYNGVKINNSTDNELTDENLTPDIEINNKKVIIYHTHTCESYTPTEQYNYEASGTYRSNDLNFSVARVGDELENQLKQYDFTVIHDKTYHDYPAYTGSYSRSLKTAQNLIQNNSDDDILIDLHRDAIADESYAPKVKIGNEYVSQLMFVIGANNPGWNQNLKFAVKVQLKANELYPGLFKPIILRNSEYNQHLAKAACIIEVGATGNTLEESINSMKYLSKTLKEI